MLFSMCSNNSYFHVKHPSLLISRNYHTWEEPIQYFRDIIHASPTVKYAWLKISNSGFKKPNPDSCYQLRKPVSQEWIWQLVLQEEDIERVRVLPRGIIRVRVFPKEMIWKDYGVLAEGWYERVTLFNLSSNVWDLVHKDPEQGVKYTLDLCQTSYPFVLLSTPSLSPGGFSGILVTGRSEWSQIFRPKKNGPLG